MKLYRYRSATDLVFKELRYSELYLASPVELNDPLDLNAQLNFFQRNAEETTALAQFLQRQALIAHGIETGACMLKLMTPERLAPFLSGSRSSNQGDTLTKDELFHGLRAFYRDCGEDEQFSVRPDVEKLTLALNRLFSQFLNNSAAVCFSQRADDFLMWSHYAGGHTGICLEFDVQTEGEDVEVAHLPLLSWGVLGGDCLVE